MAESAENGIDGQDMTLEEREKWLRERGVQIETPQDRKRAMAASSSVATIAQQISGLSLADSNDKNSIIRFVCIPHDESKPIRTVGLPKLYLTENSQIVGDALPHYVKPYFADNKSIDASLLKEQATKQFAGGDLKQLAETNLSSAAMNAAAAQGSVETFPLVHPADTNQYQGVYIYLDEVGMLKKLPSNRRASQMASTCGFHPPPNFYGDVFVGRVQTKPKLHNVDFVAGVDTDSHHDGSWMRRAVAENLAWQQEMNKVTGKTGQTQPVAAGTDGTVAEEENFSWTQDGEEIEISVPFEQAIDKKAVKVSFWNRAIKVVYAGQEVLSVKLYAGIDVDGCTWTIDGGKHLIVTCEKANGDELWPRVQS